MNRWPGALLCALLLPAFAPAAQADWIAESDRHAQLLLEIVAKYNPEDASFIGVEGHDEDVVDLKPGYTERHIEDLDAAAAKLEAARGAVKDPRVRQDIDILIGAARDERTTLELNRRLMLPYFDLPEALFSGFQDLLDERVAKKRQAAALVRLRRYVGAERGYEPVAKLARTDYETQARNAALVAPWAVEVEQNLANQPRYIEGMRALFEKSGLKGWRKDFDTLTRQLDEYADWVRSDVLPRARKTNLLPPEIYADNLKSFGVRMEPREIMDRALAAYMQTRAELESAARLLAERRGFQSADYRDVIRELKKQRIPEDKLLALYRTRLGQIETIVREQHLITLPRREAVIRLATEAESAAQPAPHVDLPRLIGNTGEPAQFVLPTRNPNATPGAEMDDFTYDAISWMLTAHEARPGHELQFASMLEQGVSTARAVFAFNSANVEGWGLYAESVMRRFFPLEAQIGVLQMRLMRAARAYLDPMLNLGLIDPETAKRVLMNEVALSEPMAKQEVDRYTFRMPGQATSYFYGYSKLEALRAKVEIALGERFAAQPYHDFIISQGLLPLDLLERAVMEDFVPRMKGGPAPPSP